MCYNGHKQEPTDIIKTIPKLLKNVPNYSIGADLGFEILDKTRISKKMIKMTMFYGKKLKIVGK